MPTVSFTDRTITALPYSQSQTEYWDASLPGFLIRVGKKTKTFQVLTGTPRTRTTIGKYPYSSLQVARTQAKKLLANPETTGHSRLTAEAREDYLNALNLRPKTTIEYTRLLHRIPFHGKLKDISTSWLLDTFAQYSASEARHMFFAASAFFSWCIQRR